MNPQDGPSARAHVGRSTYRPFGDLDVFVGYLGHHGAGLWRPVEVDDNAETFLAQAYRFDPGPSDDRAVVAPPSFRIPEELARVLLDALVAHFGAGSDVRVLNDALGVERRRVDKLIDAVIARRDYGPKRDTYIENGPRA